MKESPEMPEAQMPRYQCHKKVWALKIASIQVFTPGTPDALAGAAAITPSDAGYGTFFVEQAYLDKHAPQAGGYYVVYDGGYKSFSPA